MCGDFRIQNGYGAKVILLSRSGKVLDSDFGDKAHTPDAGVVTKVTNILKDKFQVDVKQGSVSDPKFSDPILSPGTLKLDDGSTLDFDVYIPCYPLGPNTSSLVSSKSDLLDPRGALVTNECLQSTAHPEVFGVGITTIKLFGHPVSSRITAASQHCARQAAAVIEGKQPQVFKDKGAPPPMSHPMNVKIGHGPGGYMIWTSLPGPAKVCCCQCCNGGYPCCPPPCCWCCIPGCSGACGTCGSPLEGEGPAKLMIHLLAKFPPAHGFKGLGDYGAEVPTQAKMTWEVWVAWGSRWWLGEHRDISGQWLPPFVSFSCMSQMWLSSSALFPIFVEHPERGLGPSNHHVLPCPNSGCPGCTQASSGTQCTFTYGIQ